MVLARMATTLTQLHKLFLKARKINSTKIVNAADAGFLTKLIAWMTEIRDAKDPAAEPAPEHPDNSADPAEPDQRELAALARMMSADQVAEAFPYHGGYGVGMMTKVERDIYGPQPTAEQAAAAAQPRASPDPPSASPPSAAWEKATHASGRGGTRASGGGRGPPIGCGNSGQDRGGEASTTRTAAPEVGAGPARMTSPSTPYSRQRL